jgi:hypothetical protein
VWIVCFAENRIWLLLELSVYVEHISHLCRACLSGYFSVNFKLVEIVKNQITAYLITRMNSGGPITTVRQAAQLGPVSPLEQ